MSATDAKIKARINDAHLAYLREKGGGRPLYAKGRTRAKIAGTLTKWGLIEDQGEIVLTDKGREIRAWAIAEKRSGAS